MNNDFISRQQAIKAVELGITYAKLIDTETGELLEPFKASNDELKRAVQRIKNLPSAQPTFDARDTQYNLPIGTDCISRQQAIDALYSVDEYNSRSVKAIKQLPPIRPKRGKWIEIGAFDDSRYVKCDQCKTVQVFYYGKRNTNFCPHCGADMREVTT